MRQLIIFTTIVLMSAACEKTIPLKLNESESKVVIEGLITDHEGYQFIKVSRTNDFYNTGKSPRVTNATIQVQDNVGNVFSFVHNPNNHADSAGYYLPLHSFVGEVGRTYKLTVVVDGQSYEAQDKLYPISSIEKLEYQINEDERSDPEEPGRFYEVLITITEPKETKDYYLLKCYRNGKIEYAFNTDVYYADDELIGESIDGLSLPVFYAVNDLARIEVYSLSREAFIFYRDLWKLLNNDGGLFGTPPANPRSNLSNGALGFFQASALEMGELQIEE